MNEGCLNKDMTSAQAVRVGVVPSTVGQKGPAQQQPKTTTRPKQHREREREREREKELQNRNSQNKC